MFSKTIHGSGRTLCVLLSTTAILLAAGAFLYVSKEYNRPPVRIGVVLPLSGEYETYGNMGLQGVKMAVQEINDAGGVLGGRQLELIVEDNRTDPYNAVRQTRKLIQEDDVTAIIGPVSSTALAAMTEVAAGFKTPLLYGIDYEGGLYDPWLFCYSPIPDHVVKPLVPYLSENHGTSFYIFGYDYIWPHKMAGAVRQAIRETGGTLAGVEFTPFGVQNYTENIEKIRRSGADILFLFLPGRDGFAFIRQLHESGLKKKIKVAAIASNESYLKYLSTDELEGILTTVHFLSTLDRDDTKSFVARQKKMFGKEAVVTYSTESHYGLLRLLRQAIEKAGGDNREEIRLAMEGETVVAGNGKVTMRDDHHMILNMVIAEFTKGELTATKELGPIVPESQKRAWRKE